MPFEVDRKVQHHPEVYQQIVQENPGRVLAAYIRNVSRNPNRIAKIEGLATVVAAAGSSLVLASDSVAMAKHAANLGLVAHHTVADVASERLGQDEKGAGAGTQHVERTSADETAEAIAEGELQELLTSGQEGPPPNVVVEAAERERPRELKA